MSLPVSRPAGRALVVAVPEGRAEPFATLRRMGFVCAEAADPYAALAQFCEQPDAFPTVVLSLAGLYREELSLISTLKARFPQTDVWVAQTEGRQAALAEALQHGADGFVSDDGLHRVALSGADEELTPKPVSAAPPPLVAPNADGFYPSDSHDDDAIDPDEPVLSAEELRALLQQEQPAYPPSVSED